MKQIRLLENFHIILWLMKDMCWLMHFKIGGVIMVIPTVGMAVYLCYRTRHQLSHLLPNLSVCCWIGANAIWMLGEFFDFNHVPYSFVLFLSGIVLIAYYFAKYRHQSEEL